MRKERKIINTNIRLNLCDEQDGQAWEYLPFNLLFVIFVINVGAVLIRIYLNNKNVGY